MNKCGSTNNAENSDQKSEAEEKSDEKPSDENEKSQNDLKNAMAELMLTKEQLGIEQKKNNKDIYGEN